MSHKLLFLPSNQSWECEASQTILSVALACGVMLEATCAGNGTCGKCKVQVLEGQVAPLCDKELAVLTKDELEAGYRLACHAQVEGDVVVLVPDVKASSTRKKNLNALPATFQPMAKIHKTYVEIPKATLEHQVDDLNRIRIALERPELAFDATILSELQQAMAKKRGKVTVTTHGNQVIAVDAGDTTAQNYGLAVDIGTTTAVAILWDLNTATMVDVEAATNPQSMFGADVISRIQFAMDAPENTAVLQSKIMGAINEMMETMCKNQAISPEAIHHVSVVGNTTMGHLFLGIHPQSLARVPFAPVFQQGITTKASALGLHCHGNGDVYLLPNIAGHVGSDITAVMLCTDIFRQPGNTVAIDIGTNGEILVAKDGQVLACSTAAGPAFEGASIHCGMRASKGAIEGVKLTDDVELSVLEGGQPAGLCGTGLIDTVAELLRVGLVNENGNVLSQEKARSKGISEKLVTRLFGKGNGAGFTLYTPEQGNPVVLLQSDIREVQLAKGAILGGIETLMKRLDIATEQIDRVIVAGAFGSYINQASAKRIGLLPQVDEEKIHSIGNGAGVGVSMALLSQAVEAQAEDEIKRIGHVELSRDLDFQTLYIKNMGFAN